MDILLFVVEILVHIAGVLLTLAAQHLIRLTAGGQIAAEQLPHAGAQGSRHARPAQPLQLRHVDHRLGQQPFKLPAPAAVSLRLRREDGGGGWRRMGGGRAAGPAGGGGGEGRSSRHTTTSSSLQLGNTVERE